MTVTTVRRRAIASAAPANARCGTCGFYLPLAGSLRLVFGACGNMFAPDDGRVVSADHGCGAHSEVLVETVAPVEELPTVYDDGEVEPVGDGEPLPAVTVVNVPRLASGARERRRQRRARAEPTPETRRHP